MGCWGITAMESDCGLDTRIFIREMISDRRLTLELIITALKKDDWFKPPALSSAEPHTSIMLLAEVIVKYLDQDLSGMDWEEDINKFRDVVSFAASKESIQYIRDYLDGTLKNIKKREARRNDWGGWFEKENWLKWQEHMTKLIKRLDEVLSISFTVYDFVDKRSMN